MSETYMNYFNDLNLSTITVESKISNIKFKECDLIPKLSLPDKMPEVIKIGCNYGEYISDKFIEMTTAVKKSNRGRKKKNKPISNRKIQGNGKYFNSQITFTILDPINDKKFYHLKLYTNGTIQITYVCYEDINLIRPIIDLVISIIKPIDSIKVDLNEEIKIVYLKSIMRNYKFNIIQDNIFIDLNKFKTLLLNFKNYQLEHINKQSEIKQYFQDNQDYDYKLLLQLEIGLIKCNFEKYTGIIVKFKTPLPDKVDKLTTVKIFSSGKINIDGSNNFDESSLIKQIISSLIYNNKSEILYSK
jgi:hypothetical protein